MRGIRRSSLAPGKKRVEKRRGEPLLYAAVLRPSSSQGGGIPHFAVFVLLVQRGSLNPPMPVHGHFRFGGNRPGVDAGLVEAQGSLVSVTAGVTPVYGLLFYTSQRRLFVPEFVPEGRLIVAQQFTAGAVSYTHLTLPTTPYV